MSIQIKYTYQQRLTLVIVVFALVSVLGAIAVARARRAGRNVSASTRPSSAEPKRDEEFTQIKEPSAACCSPAPSGKDTFSAVALPTFVAPGFHAAFENASYDKSNGKQTITVTATNRGAEKLESLDVLLLDFTSQGTVSRMEKRTLTLAVAPNAKQTAAFESTLPRDLGQSQTLSIASVTHETKKQDVDLQSLAKALAIQKAGGSPPGLAIAEKAKSQAGPSSTICFDWFQLVHNIASDNNSAVTGFACNQSQRSFSAMFAVR